MTTNIFGEAPSGAWRMEAVFYEAELVGGTSGIVEWLPVEQLEVKLYHACHVWAVRSLLKKR